MRKVKQDSRTYLSREKDVMSSFAPPIYPCDKCGNPVAHGYVCRYCDHDNSDNQFRTL